VTSLPLITHCPKSHSVGTSASIDHLKQMLERGEDITVWCSECKQNFKLSAAEREALSRRITQEQGQQ
jgi:hypothetical protein